MKGSNLPKVIYIMGPPGAGKGTQAEMLARKIGYLRFSTGDAFRALAREDTPLGRRVDDIIHGQGKLMPPEDAAAIVIGAIKKYLKSGHGLVFDGTPRTIKEAQLVDSYFIEVGYGRPGIILLVVDKQDMIARNSRRQFCLGIGGDFPVATEADRERCLTMGGRVGVREDDQAEKLNTRWQEFEDKTRPVIKKYEAVGNLQAVNGKQSIENVHKEVMHVLSLLETHD